MTCKNCKTKKKLLGKQIADLAGEALAHFYDTTLIKMMSRNLFYTGKLRNKRVPKYLKIRIPVIRRHFCEDSCDSGFFITTKKITLFKIGTEVIKVPVLRKGKIRFRRHSSLGKK